jgi:hypothetical protein
VTAGSAHMSRMSAFENQLQAALARLGDTNPMFDYATADEDTRYRQLKTWWGRPLAEDARAGHDISGPLTLTGEANDRQLVLLSFLQRPLRVERSGDWSVTATPAPGDSLRLTAACHGQTLSATVTESAGAVNLTGIDGAGEMLFRSNYLEAPAADLIDALALAAALSESPFAGLTHPIRRSGTDTIEAPDLDIYLDWAAMEATPDGDIEGLAAAAGIPAEQVRPAFSAVMHRAVDLGHGVPGARPSDTPLPAPVAVAAPSGGTELPEGHPARAVLDAMGIDWSETKVVGIGPGSSVGMGIGIGQDGGLAITDLPGLGATVPVDDEEFAAECAKVLGISAEEFRAILQEEEDSGE